MLTLQERLNALQRDQEQEKKQEAIARYEAARGAVGQAYGSSYAAASGAVKPAAEPSPVGSSYAAASGALQSEEEKNLQRRLEELGKASEELPLPSVGERVGLTLSGAGKQYGGSMAQTASTAVDTLGVPGILDLAGRFIHPSKAPTYHPAGDALLKLMTAPMEKRMVEVTQDAADKWSESGARDTERAREGLDPMGKILVGAGTSGAQMAADYTGALLTGGGSMVIMAARAFGSGVQEARAKGYDKRQQVALGLTSAATEYLTEKLFGGNPVYDTDVGLVNRLVGKLVKNPKVMEVLASAPVETLNEGLEEIVSDLLNPVAEWAITGTRPEYELDQILEDGAVGVLTALLAKGGQTVGRAVLPGKAAGGASPSPTDIFQGERKVTPEVGKTSGRDPLIQAMLGQENITPGGVETTDGGEAEVQLPAAPGEQKTASTGEAGRVYHGQILDSIRANIGQIQTMEPVAALTGMEFQKTAGDTRSLRVKVIDFFNSIGNKVTRGDIGEIELNTAGARDSTAHGYGKLKAATFAALPDVLKKGKIIETRGPYEGHEYNSYTIAAPATVDGELCYVGAVVIKDEKVQRYKIHEVLTTNESGTPLFKSESSDISAESPLRNGAPLETPEGASTDIILPQGGKDVKGEFARTGDPLIQAMLGQKEFTPEGGKISGEEGPVGVGAAAEGFTSGTTPETRTSRVHESTQQYNRIKAEAAGILEGTGEERRGAWRELFSYKTQSEGQSMQRAGELLYAEIGGRREFIRDFDPEGYRALLEELESTQAWDGVQTDASQMILDDLLFRVREGTAANEEYARWLKVDKDHSVSTAQGLQARAKWSRDDNEHGHASSLEAWKNLERSKLTAEERTARFNQVIRYNQSIEAAENAGDLTGIILEIAGERGTLKGLTGRQSRVLRSLAESALGGLDMDQLRQFAYQSATALTTDSVPADLGRKLKTVQILNMLSNPKTAAKNLTGNTTFYALDALTMRGAALLDMAVSKLTGTRSVAMEGSLLTDAKAREATVRAVRMSLAEITLDVDMGGGSRYDTGSNRTFKASGNLFDRVMSSIERNQGYLLTTTDELYKGMARATESGTQRLVDQGKIRTADPDYAGKRADELAKYRTFQNDGKLSTSIQSIHDLLNMAVGIGDSGKRSKGGHVIHAFGAGDLVAPFTKVAGNLASVGLDYSPVNAVKGTVELVDVLRRTVTGERVDASRQYRAVSDVARGLTGTAVAMGFAALAQAGLVKRSEDEEDPDIAALNRSEGMTGTQINIDAAKRWVEEDFSAGAARWRQGDTLVDLSNLEPINFMVSLGVELAGNENDGILSTFGDVNTYRDTVLSAAETAGDLPILQSVGTFAKDTMVYKKDLLEAAAEMLGKTAISSVTPNIVAAFAKGLDDKQRSAYSGDGVKDVLVDTLLSRIPVLRERLPTVVDTVGKEKENAGDLPQRLLNAMLNPIGVNEYTQSEVSRELERVREETGETGFYPTTRKPKEIGYTDKEGQRHEVSLSYEDRQRFQASCAAEQMAVTTAMMDSAVYRKAGGKEQAALLKRCYDYAYQKAKGAVLGEEAMDAWVRNADRAKEDIGFSTVEYFYYYEKYGSELMSGSGYEKTQRMVKAGLSVDQWAGMKGKLDADESGSVNKKELTGYIEANFPKEQWSQVFRAYVGGGKWKNPY